MQLSVNALHQKMRDAYIPLSIVIVGSASESFFPSQGSLGQIQYGALLIHVRELNFCLLYFLDFFFQIEKMPSENILSHFWELASIDENKRLKAASQLLHALNQAQRQHDERRKVT